MTQANAPAGRTAIVTGSARGIGRAIAERLLSDGLRVVVSNLDAAAARSTAEELAGIGPTIALPCDVTRKAEVLALVAAAERAFGGVDVLVNNAGIATPAPFLDIDEELFDRVVAVNLKGVFLCAQAAARVMAKRVVNGGLAGCIVNIASVQARIAGPEFVPYAASKAGVAQMTTAMAMALAPHGIRVNAVAPGSIATEMLRAVLTPEARDAVLARTPLGRIGEASEIAAAVAFLASDQASYVTGQTLYVDGGRTGLAFTMPRQPEKAPTYA